MTKEKLEARIAKLEQDKAQFVDNAKGQLAAIEGAIQDSQYWLAQLNTAENMADVAVILKEKRKRPKKAELEQEPVRETAVR